MALLAEHFATLEALLLAAVPGVNPLPALRAALPDITVLRYGTEDMREETPYRSAGHYHLYLVDRSDHCWQLTDDPQRAGGVIIAARA